MMIGKSEGSFNTQHSPLDDFFSLIGTVVVIGVVLFGVAMLDRWALTPAVAVHPGASPAPAIAESPEAWRTIKVIRIFDPSKTYTLPFGTTFPSAGTAAEWDRLKLRLILQGEFQSTTPDAEMRVDTNAGETLGTFSPGARVNVSVPPGFSIVIELHPKQASSASPPASALLLGLASKLAQGGSIAQAPDTVSFDLSIVEQCFCTAEWAEKIKEGIKK